MNEIRLFLKFHPQNVFTNHIHLIGKCKQDLVLNNLRGFINL